MLDFPLMLWFKPLTVDSIHEQSNRFVASVVNKATSVSKLNEFPAITTRSVVFLLSLVRGSVAKWFRALDLKSTGPWFKSSTLLLSGLVLGSRKFISFTALCK